MTTDNGSSSIPPAPPIMSGPPPAGTFDRLVYDVETRSHVTELALAALRARIADTEVKLDTTEGSTKAGLSALRSQLGTLERPGQADAKVLEEHARLGLSHMGVPEPRARTVAERLDHLEQSIGQCIAAIHDLDRRCAVQEGKVTAQVEEIFSNDTLVRLKNLEARFEGLKIGEAPTKGLYNDVEALRAELSNARAKFAEHENATDRALEKLIALYRALATQFERWKHDKEPSRADMIRELFTSMTSTVLQNLQKVGEPKDSE